MRRRNVGKVSQANISLEEQETEQSACDELGRIFQSYDLELKP